MKTVKKFAFPIFFIVFIFHIIFRIYAFSPEYTITFDPVYWEDRYNTSQWVVSESKNPIGDDGLYAYAGWEYIHGANPVLLNAEIPPLGKYIIGIGTVVFQNQNILMLLIGLVSLFVLFALNKKIFSSNILAFIPVFIFSFDPLFYAQLRAPYLDTIYLSFLLLALLFTVDKKYFLASFFLGCFAATKFPAGSLVLALTLMSWVLLFDRKQIKRFIASLLLWPGVFILSYSMFFIQGGSFFEFLGVQKWIISFYSGAVAFLPGGVFPMIFSGAWFTWFDGVQQISEWTILWPLSFLFSVLSLILIIRLYIKHPTERLKLRGIGIILLWVFFYAIFLIFTPIFPRYLLLLLPFMYNLTVWFLRNYRLLRF